MIDIILFLIALGVCILIGVAAAFERVALYNFAIVDGLPERQTIGGQ